MGTSMLTCTPKRRWAIVEDLPNELLLTIFPLLSLKSLIAAKGACRHWQTLVREAHLNPVRRKLLDLFEHVVSATPSGTARPRVSQHYCDSDRDEYLHFLTRNADAPEDFVLWVREWPAWGVYGWLWPDLDESKRRPAPPGKGLVVECAQFDSGMGGWGVSGYGWSEPVSVAKPHVKCITFCCSSATYEPGALLRAKKIVPVEFAGIGIQMTGFMTEEGDGMDDEPCLEVVVLCFGGGNRVLVLDGKNGGEELKGLVYAVTEGFAIEEQIICSRTWVEYLHKYLMTPHPPMAPLKFHAVSPTFTFSKLVAHFVCVNSL